MLPPRTLIVPLLSGMLRDRQRTRAVAREQLLRRLPQRVLRRHIGARAVVEHQPQRLRIRFVEVAALVIGAQHVLQLAHRRSRLLRRRLPLREARCIDRQHPHRRGLRRLIRLEDAHFGAIDERRVVVVHPEAHRRAEQPRRAQLRHVALLGLNDFGRRRLQPASAPELTGMTSIELFRLAALLCDSAACRGLRVVRCRQQELLVRRLRHSRDSSRS